MKMREMFGEDGFVVNPTRKEIDEILRSSIIDEHNGEEFMLDGLVVLANGEAAPYYNGCYFCINGLFKSKDGRLHLSTSSIGGTVVRGSDVKKRVLEYNNSLMEMFKDSKSIKEYHCKDYSIFF